MITLAEFVTWEAIIAVSFFIWACSSPGRRAFAALFRQMRWMYIEWPLRMILHRPRPDYRRIRELERDLGWRP